MSREGKFLKEVFENYLSATNKSVSADIHYMYISRKSSVLAGLKDIEYENFDSFKVYQRMNILLMLKAFDFSDNEISQLENELINIDFNVLVEKDAFFKSNDFEALKQNKLFKELYDRKRIKAKENLFKYLLNCGFTNANKAAVVDVGWNATVQNQLYSTGVRKTIYGYYIGLSKAAVSSRNDVKEGLLFNSQKSDSVFSMNNHYYEYLCVADHGSTEGYDDFGNPIIENDTDIYLYDEIFCKIQKHVIDKLRLISKAVMDYPTDDNLEDLFSYYHLKMLLGFTKEEKSLIKKSIKNHSDNFINLEFKKTIKYYIFIVLRSVKNLIELFKYCVHKK